MHAPGDETPGILGEIANGLACASRAHYADAAAHFAAAREQLPSAQSQLLAALDAFIESHGRYWEAQQALHDASHHFVLVSTDQEARLADLQEALSAARAQPAELPRALLAQHQTGRHSPQPSTRVHGSTLPELSLACLGRFAVWRDGEAVDLCRNRNGQAVLRYLAAHPRHRAGIEVLSEALWPEDDPGISRHKLHVAVSALRRALNGGFHSDKGGGYLLHQDGAYQLNDAIRLTVDVDEFERLYRAGQRAAGSSAVADYEAACRLYAGPLLPDDLYADWLLVRREQLSQMYVEMCGTLATHYASAQNPDQAARWAMSVLEEDRCNEAAHRQLMRAFMASGRRTDALRQYQRCERVLADEMGVQPMPETTALFYALLRGEIPFGDPKDS